MKTVLTSPGGARRASVVFVVMSMLALSVISSRAYSPAHFVAVQSQIQNDIDAVASLPSPTRADRRLLRSLQRGSKALTKTSIADGKTLRSLNSILGRQENYTPVLGAIGSNLLTGFNAEMEFVENLLLELPESGEATAVKVQFQKFGPTSAKLNAAATLAKFAGRYDAAKRKLDGIFIRANQALLIPFPADLSENSVSAKINGPITLRASASSSTLNEFQAVATETNLSVTVNAVFYTGPNTPTRGILFTVPNVQFGTFRSAIPTAASFTNRTGLLPQETETNSGATNGSIFISTTATEVYGTFSCSGPDFNISDGRFRITISSQP